MRLRLPADRLDRAFPAGWSASPRANRSQAHEARQGAVEWREARQEGLQTVSSGWCSSVGRASPSSASSRRSANSPARCMNFDLGPWETFWTLFYGASPPTATPASCASRSAKPHVPVRALPERDVRPRHPDRHLRRGAANNAAVAKPAPTIAPTASATAPTARWRAGLPTGIDIRNGLQSECIACAACIDATDAVMDKMGYPRGLVRYATQHQLEHQKTHVLRPRIPDLRRAADAADDRPGGGRVDAQAGGARRAATATRALFSRKLDSGGSRTSTPSRSRTRTSARTASS